ncbi:MAG: hypothetical protein COA99_08985 [Moraxellaceae bacterium]|nr:MAG: hypothetical protein COA99_08985 [Moraxellaceae bacterium]
MAKVYFAKKGLSAPQGASAHVRYSYGTAFTGNVDSKLEGAISEGISALNCATTYLANTDTADLNANFKYYAEKYFLLGDTPTTDELNNIYAVLLLTKNGLNNKFTIKVYSSASHAPKGFTTNGYVTSYLNPKDNQKHRTAGVWTDPSTMVGKNAFKGDIHMGISTVKGQSDLTNASLFIHEATHKFADTADFGEQGYTTDQGSFRKPGLQPAQALMNAESYARFAIHFHRGEKGMKQW